MTKLMIKISKVEQIQKKIFWSLLSLIVVAFIAYLCLLNIAIGETVGRKNALNDIQGVRAEYQQLEGEYFALANEIDIDYALSLGFVEQKNIAYITRTVQTAMAR
jgi:uncharacterized protein (UPF0262 family)